MPRATFQIVLATLVLLVTVSSLAEQGVLVVQISDTQGQPIQGVVVGTKGDGSVSARSDVAGRARVQLSAQSRPGDWVQLQVIARLSGNRDWVFISPWDEQVIVPSFDNKPGNFVPLVLGLRSDKALLSNRKAISSITQSILKEYSAKNASGAITPEQRQAVLADQAQKYGLKPEEIDKAIRSWLTETSSRGTDRGSAGGDQRFEQGLAALYARNYPEATSYLMASLEQSKKELEKAQAQVADNAFFLGQALFEQRQYGDAADNYRVALTLRPNDGVILNNLGLSLRLAGKTDEAESYSRRAVVAKGADPRFGPSHPATAIATLNLAVLYRDLGKTADADSTFQQALKISENAFGPESPEVVTCLDYYSNFLQSSKRDAEAADVQARAKSIRDKAYAQGRKEAIANARKTLDLKTRGLGPEHPDVATAMIQLADVLPSQGNFAEAERLYKSALAIRDRNENKSPVGDVLMSLVGFYIDQSKYAEAEPFCKQEIAIYEKIPSEYYRLVGALRQYSQIMKATGRSAEAVPIDNQILAIQQKHGFVPNRVALPNEPGGIDVQQRAPVLNQRAIPIEERQQKPLKP
jgi:tetratricopeptide (TPR) repeat protein